MQIGCQHAILWFEEKWYLHILKSTFKHILNNPTVCMCDWNQILFYFWTQVLYSNHSPVVICLEVGANPWCMIFSMGRKSSSRSVAENIVPFYSKVNMARTKGGYVSIRTFQPAYTWYIYVNKCVFEKSEFNTLYISYKGDITWYISIHFLYTIHCAYV